MKIGIFLLLITVIQSFAVESYSQTALINLNMEKATIGEVLTQIESQSEFFFLYSPKIINVKKEVSIEVINKTISEILPELFAGTDVNYIVIDRQIVLSNVPIEGSVKAQPKKQISGKVTDTKGTPLTGVSIVVKGTTNGTITDIRGNFNLEVPPDAQILVFSFIGMKTLEIPIEDVLIFDVSMEEEIIGMDEIIVVGYGTQRKKDLTGSVSRADISTMQESPNVSLGSVLQGALAGLNVGAVNTAGSDPAITIRGRTSISGSNSPLIVLDGIIYRGNLIDINPNDIQSIDVLKDASAAAIYGSQASNGVIIITSRIAKIMQKPSIEYNVTYSLQEITNKKFLPQNGEEFIEKIEHRFLEESRLGEDLLIPNPAFDPSTKFYGPEILAGYQNGVENNWLELLSNKNPLLINHNLNVSGKSELSSYFFSLGLTDQENIVKNDTYKRYNFRVNLDTKITNWLKVGMQSFLSLSDYSGTAPSLSNLNRTPPQVPYLDGEGNYILQPYRGMLNPFLEIGRPDLEKRYNLFGNVYADINIPFIEGLNYRLNFSNNLINYKHFNFDQYAQNFTGESFKINSSEYNQTLDNIISYRRTFGDHSVNGTFVYGIEKRNYESTDALAKNFSNIILGYNKLDAGVAGLQTASSTAWEENSLYSMLRLGYIYKDRYIFTGTYRRDGFSGFGPNNKFAQFPSAAFAWRLSEEDFIRSNVPLIDDLKLRVSYGENGNRTVGRYETLSRIASSVTTGYLYGDVVSGEQGQYITSLPNYDLKWETTKSLNFGADVTVLNNRLSGSFDFYLAKTFDLLYNINIPVMNGKSTIATNIGELSNSGQELTLIGVPVKKKDFNWEITFNFSRNRNKVESILGQDINGDGKEDDLVSSKIFMGHPYGVVYDFNIIGMWQLEDYHAGIIPGGFTYGTYKVEDINKDGAYTAAADRKILGYTDPSYRFSFLNTLNFKDWELKFFINAIQGGKDYFYGQPGNSLQNPDNAYGWNSFVFDYWTPENPDARYRQIGYYTVALGSEFSPYIQRNFVRVQDLILSYNLPSSTLQKIKVNKFKVFFAGKNLLTITGWDGYDPETGTGLENGAYPVLKSYSLGLNVEF